jgi:hypothetical protein
MRILKFLCLIAITSLSCDQSQPQSPSIPEAVTKQNPNKKCGSCGFVLLNSGQILDPPSATIVSSVDVRFDSMNSVRCGDFAYILGDRSSLVDIRHPYHPAASTFAEFDNSHFTSVQTVGEFLYADNPLMGPFGAQHEILIFDISDARNPSFVRSVAFPSPADPSKNALAQITSKKKPDMSCASCGMCVLPQGNDSLAVVDVSTEVPKLVSYIDTGWTRDLVRCGDYLYMQSSRGYHYLAIDLSNPTKPSIEEFDYYPEPVGELQIAGSHLYVREYGDVSCLPSQVADFDISDPLHPVRVTTTPLPAPPCPP